MGVFEQFPYTNFHDLNVDKLLEITGEVKAKADDIDAALADAENAATRANVSAISAEQSAENALATANDFADDIENINNDIADNVSAIGANTAAINIERARIDNIISGVTPDANVELTDIRVGNDGYTYATAGDAVRAQTLHNKQVIDFMLDDITDINSLSGNTNRGITYTIDNINRAVIANGTSTGSSYHTIATGITGIDKAIIAGGVAGGTASTYFLGLYNSANNRVAYDIGNPNGVYVELDANETYTMRIYVLNGVVANNMVFKPRLYVEGEVFNLLTDIRKANNLYDYYAGNLFISKCGTEVIIDAVGWRVFNHKTRTYPAAVTGTFTLTGLPLTTIRYINFDGSTFSASSTYNETSIAFTRDGLTFPLMPKIITDCRQPQPGYLRAGSSYNINFERLGYAADLAYNSPNIKITKAAYILNSAGTHKINSNNYSYDLEITGNSANISNKTVLMIGDSFVRRGYLQHYINELDPTINFIGTKTTINYGYMCEGISGARLYEFTDTSTSPFAYNGVLDLGAYLTNNNLTPPDYVVIVAGINHSVYNNSTYGTFDSNVTTLVSMVNAYDPDIKIYVADCPNYAMSEGSSYGYPSLRWQEVHKCGLSTYAVSGVTVVPLNQCLIDSVDYPTQDVNYYGNDVKILADCVHPTAEQGFNKMAQMLYNYLGI